MRRLCAIIVAMIMLIMPAGLSAQEAPRFPFGIDITRGVIHLGTAVALEMEGSTNDAFEMRFVVDPTEDVTLEWPATYGTAGTQLQTTAGGVLSWASAGSTRDIKILTGLLTPADALQAVLSAPIHRFKYKPHQGTQDAHTEYAGIVADEAPWAMHHGGTILNPINTAGYTMGAIQALQAEIEALKAQLAAIPQPSALPKRPWWAFWRRR